MYQCLLQFVTFLNCKTCKMCYNYIKFSSLTMHGNVFQCLETHLFNNSWLKFKKNPYLEITYMENLLVFYLILHTLITVCMDFYGVWCFQGLNGQCLHVTKYILYRSTILKKYKKNKLRKPTSYELTWYWRKTKTRTVQVIFRCY